MEKFGIFGSHIKFPNLAIGVSISLDLAQCPGPYLGLAQVPTLRAQTPGHNAQVPTFGGFSRRHNAQVPTCPGPYLEGRDLWARVDTKGTCKGYSSPGTGGSEDSLGHHRLQLHTRWGTPRASHRLMPSAPRDITWDQRHTFSSTLCRSCATNLSLIHI